MDKNIFTIDSDCSGMTVKEYILDYLGYSVGVLKKLKYSGKITVNGKEVFVNHLLSCGEILQLTYPEENSGNKDMAVLQAAADEWKDKWDHWYQYCYEQHYAYVNPILVIQVQNATSSSISATDLDDCVQKIEERTGIRFQEGEVVHTFGDANNVIRINGLNVPYVAPSAIV